MKEFADLLRRLRLAAGRSQNALAKEIGVDPSYINRIERGQRQPPSVAVVHKLVRALGLDELRTNQLLLSAGYAPMAHVASAVNPFHPGLQLLTDFLGDDSIPQDDRDMIERDLDLLEQHIRLIRRRGPGQDGREATRASLQDLHRDKAAT